MSRNWCLSSPQWRNASTCQRFWFFPTILSVFPRKSEQFVQFSCELFPQEICTKAKVNPRTVQKPITKKWCYNPSEESGLAWFWSQTFFGGLFGQTQATKLPKVAEIALSSKIVKYVGVDFISIWLWFSLVLSQTVPNVPGSVLK